MNLLSLLFPVVAAVSSPMPPATPAPITTAPSPSQRIFQNGASEISVQTTGTVTFDLASDAIFDLHGNGTLRVREQNGNDVRLLTAQQSQVTYRVNGTVRPYDDAAKAWLRQIIQSLPADPPPPPPHA